jgi:hypothetical protein
MKVLLIIYIQSLVAINMSLAQSAPMLFWQEDLKLSWDNFEGIPPNETPYEAMTASGIEYSYQANNRNGIMKFNFTVRAYFNPKNSWVKPTSRTDQLLSHEQLHFDISELHARVLEKELKDASLSENFKEEISNIYNSVINRRAEMQELYDKETDHSRNGEKQIQWIRRIENLFQK